MHDMTQTAADTVLELDGLTRTYGSRRAVDGLSLSVRSGEIFGFLGPNGAGKSTTIRMAMGLVRPTAGSVRVLGRDVWREGPEALPHVGALIESPALYPHLSGLDNLRVMGAMLGVATAGRLREVLEVVQLADRAKDRVGTYSLGMKQRLAIGIALIDEPELLVLDEPANGLDPAGIVDMRDLLRRLADDGTTVFVSSHVLHEIQQTCDRVAIIDRGRLVRLAPVDELVRDPGEFSVRVDSPEEALAVLRAQPWGRAARLEGDEIVTPSPTARGRDLWQCLASAGYPPDEVAARRHSLEEVFLQLTNQQPTHQQPTNQEVPH
jgi:ABC-2 type transport system ATP-binding protein